MRRQAILLALGLVVACRQPPQRQPEAPGQSKAAPAATQPGVQGAAPAVPGAPVDDAASIVGEWRVAGTGNQALSQPYGMSATIGPTTIRIVSQCVHLAWTYQLANGLIETARVPPSVVPCLRARSADEMAIEAALDAATGARRLDSGALVFSGPGGSAILFTQ